MPSAAPKEDDERIIAWRETRARVAQEERDERLRKRDEARANLEAERSRIRRDTARALLPQEDAILAARHQMRTRNFKRAIGFWVQFSVCVLAPIAIAVWYLTVIATPLFEARTVIAITKPNGANSNQADGILGRFAGTANLQEVFMADEYVHSQALMDLLEADLGLVTRFSSDQIDPVFRLRVIDDLPFTQRQQFNRFVESAVNVQTGLLTIYVRDPDHSRAVQTSESIIQEAATQINALNAAVLDQRVSLAQSTVSDSQEELRQARSELIALQLRNGEIDPQRSIASIYDTIQSMEMELLGVGNEIARAQIVGIGQGRSAQNSADIYQHLQQQIAQLRGRLTTPDAGNDHSLNEMLMEYELANLRVELAQESHASALLRLSRANEDGVLGQSVFQVVVPPRTAAQTVFPRTPSLVTLVAIIALAAFAFMRLLSAGRRNLA